MVGFDKVETLVGSTVWGYEREEGKESLALVLSGCTVSIFERKNRVEGYLSWFMTNMMEGLNKV